VLYLHFGVPQEAGSKETSEGHVVRYAPATNRVVGLTVLGARRISERDGPLAVADLISLQDMLGRHSTPSNVHAFGGCRACCKGSRFCARLLASIPSRQAALQASTLA
jgi:hypothetical protein